MDDLKQQAEELGIKVDARWGEQRLQSEIDRALGAPVEPVAEPARAEVVITVRVNRDFWVSAGEAGRIRKGQVIDLPLERALDGIESGAVSRVK